MFFRVPFEQEATTGQNTLNIFFGFSSESPTKKKKKEEKQTTTKKTHPSSPWLPWPRGEDSYASLVLSQCDRFPAGLGLVSRLQLARGPAPGGLAVWAGAKGICGGKINEQKFQKMAPRGKKKREPRAKKKAPEGFALAPGTVSRTHESAGTCSAFWFGAWWKVRRLRFWYGVFPPKFWFCLSSFLFVGSLF